MFPLGGWGREGLLLLAGQGRAGQGCLDIHDDQACPLKCPHSTSQITTLSLAGPSLGHRSILRLCLCFLCRLATL